MARVNKEATSCLVAASTQPFKRRYLLNASSETDLALVLRSVILCTYSALAFTLHERLDCLGGKRIFTRYENPLSRTVGRRWSFQLHPIATMLKDHSVLVGNDPVL